MNDAKPAETCSVPERPESRSVLAKKRYREDPFYRETRKVEARARIEKLQNDPLFQDLRLVQKKASVVRLAIRKLEARLSVLNSKRIILEDIQRGLTEEWFARKHQMRNRKQRRRYDAYLDREEKKQIEAAKWGACSEGAD